jgi:integrase
MSDRREPYRLQRQALLKANGPVESFTSKMIGDRDGWTCGICQDPAHPADPAASNWHPLRATVDHIIPPSGGRHTRDNAQIAYWFCNRQKEDRSTPDPLIISVARGRRPGGVPLASKPYDFRHAGVSWRLNAGAPPPQVAEWAGHTVEVLHRIYTHCIDGQDERWFSAMENALGGEG